VRAHEFKGLPWESHPALLRSVLRPPILQATRGLLPAKIPAGASAPRAITSLSFVGTLNRFCGTLTVTRYARRGKTRPKVRPRESPSDYLRLGAESAEFIAPAARALGAATSVAWRTRPPVPLGPGATAEGCLYEGGRRVVRRGGSRGWDRVGMRWLSSFRVG